VEQRIIYPTQDGGVAVIIPAPCGLEIDQIAHKDVPPGVPFRIINVDDVPTDREFRDAWQADFSNPDGYGLGAEAWFAQQEQA
jgi:hypothetical protein